VKSGTRKLEIFHIDGKRVWTWLTTQTAVAAVMLINMAHWSIIRNVSSATLAILFLALVGAGLVYATLYALFYFRVARDPGTIPKSPARLVGCEAGHFYVYPTTRPNGFSDRRPPQLLCKRVFQVQSSAVPRGTARDS
jgi:hypothetical protein